MNEYKKWALAERLAPSTINRRLGFLKLYSSWGVEQGKLDFSVNRTVRDVGLARQQKLAPKALAQSDVLMLLKEVDLRASVRDKAIIYTLLYTGLREGELAHLQIEDVELSERKGTIVIRGEHAKGGKQRQVPVPIEACKQLKACMDEDPGTKGALFQGQRGSLGEDAVARIVKKYAAWAQIEGVTPHVLRHTFSYAYREKTTNDLVGLGSILGHDNLTTTQIYTQKPLGKLQEEIEKVGYY